MANMLPDAPATPDADALPEPAPAAPVPVRTNSAGVPSGAAHGDDDLMSEPPKKLAPAPPVEAPAANWPQQIDAAQATWSKLSEPELLRTEGVEHRLILLVQQRYAITRVRATRQVKSFLAEQAA